MNDSEKRRVVESTFTFDADVDVECLDCGDAVTLSVVGEIFDGLRFGYEDLGSQGADPAEMWQEYAEDDGWRCMDCTADHLGVELDEFLREEGLK